MKTIRSKILTAFIGLIIFLYILLLGFILYDKYKEDKKNIFIQNISIIEAIKGQVANDYELYYKKNNKELFIKDVKKLLSNAPYIKKINIYHYSGEEIISIDGIHFKKGNYDKIKDNINGQDIKENTFKLNEDRVKKIRISVQYKNGEVAYVDKTYNILKPFKFFDINGKDLITYGYLYQTIDNIGVPISNDIRMFAEIEYYGLYDFLLKNLQFLLFLFGISLIVGIFLSYRIANSIVIPLREVMIAGKRISQGDLDFNLEIETNDETKELANIFNKMSKDIKVYHENLEQEARFKGRQGLISEMFHKTLPDFDKLSIKGYDIYGGIETFERVGGDCFDVLDIGEGKYIIFVGDVSGHDVRSGFTGIAIMFLMYAYAEHSTGNLGILIQSLNRVILKRTGVESFVSMVIGVLDTNNDSFNFTLLGHPDLLKYSSDRNKAGYYYTERTKPLGMKGNYEINFEEKEVLINNKDVLVLYTDGIIDVSNKEKNPLGKIKFKQILESSVTEKMTAKEIYNKVKDVINEYTIGVTQSDDVTLLVIKKI